MTRRLLTLTAVLAAAVLAQKGFAREGDTNAPAAVAKCDFRLEFDSI
jgi:hypothetical protein